jgi:hypothetical protein
MERHAEGFIETELVDSSWRRLLKFKLQLESYGNVATPSTLERSIRVIACGEGVCALESGCLRYVRRTVEKQKLISRGEAMRNHKV